MLKTTDTIDTSRVRFIDPGTALLFATPLAFVLKDNPKALTAIALSLTVLLGLDTIFWLFDRSAKKAAESMSLEQLFAVSKVELTPIDYTFDASPGAALDAAEHEAKLDFIISAAVDEAAELGNEYRTRVLSSFLSQTKTPSGSTPQGAPAALHS